jgi:hypothetical protein
MEHQYLEEEKYLSAKKKVEKIKGFYWHLFWYVFVNGYLLAMIYRGLDADENMFEYGHFATPFFWGIGLAFHWFGVFGKNIVFSKEWEDRKMKEFMDKDKFDL